MRSRAVHIIQDGVSLNRSYLPLGTKWYKSIECEYDVRVALSYEKRMEG